MDTIFEQIIPDKQVIFDKHYIEDLYLSYMKKGEANEERLLVLKDSVADKKVMLIAPGKSSEEEKEKIIQYAKKNDVVTISVNFDYKELPVDYIFVSNIRRFNALEETVSSKTIITSNISATNCLLKTNYIELVNCEERVSDNAGLMLIKFLMKLGVKEIALAGFDGYSYANEQNYAKSAMRLSYKKSDLDALNNGLTRVLKEYKKEIDIDFVTTERFIRL
jgi:4-hydroxy 2-oxovalerate aldolase